MGQGEVNEMRPLEVLSNTIASWISHKILLKYFLTKLLDKGKQTNNGEMYRQVQKQIQELVNSKISAREFLIFLEKQLPDDLIDLLENRNRSNGIQSHQSAASTSNSPNVQRNASNHENQTPTGNDGNHTTTTNDNEANESLNNTRKRPHNNLEISNTDTSNSSNSLVLAIATNIVSESVEDGQQPGPSNAKIPLVSTTTTTDSAFDKAKQLKSNEDQLDNMEDMIQEYDMKAGDFENLRLDALTKDEEIAKLKQELEEHKKKMGDMFMENWEVVKMYKDENETLRLEAINKDEKNQQLSSELEEREQKIAELRSEIEKRDETLADKDEQINNFENELAEAEFEKIQEISDIKSKLNIQIACNVKNEEKIRKLGQEINSRNSQIQDLQSICANFTAQVTSSCTNLLPESVDIVIDED